MRYYKFYAFNTLVEMWQFKQQQLQIKSDWGLMVETEGATVELCLRKCFWIRTSNVMSSKGGFRILLEGVRLVMRYEAYITRLIPSSASLPPSSFVFVFGYARSFYIHYEVTNSEQKKYNYIINMFINTPWLFTSAKHVAGSADLHQANGTSSRDIMFPLMTTFK